MAWIDPWLSGWTGSIPAFDTTFWPDFRGQAYVPRAVLTSWHSDVDTAGDQSVVMHGTNTLWAYTLGWEALTPDQHAAMRAAIQFAGGGASALYWLDWRPLSSGELTLGETVGVEDVFALRCRLTDDDPVTAGLVVALDEVPLVLGRDYDLETLTGANYVEHVVQIHGAGSGSTATASWDSARRRRSMRALAWSLADGPNDVGLYVASMDLVESEADLP